MPGLEKLKQIPGGYAGTEQTIREMKALVDQAKKRKDIITLARSIVWNVPERDAAGEANAVFRWVQKNIRFVNDPYDVETLTEPWHLVKEAYPSEDCDGLSTTYNSLMASLGYDTAFRTIKADPRAPGEFSHVYSVVYLNGVPVAADPSQKDKPFGWEPPSHFGRQEWGYSKGRLQVTDMPPSLKGLGMPQQVRGVDITRAVMNLVMNLGKRKAAPAVDTSQIPAGTPPDEAFVPTAKVAPIQAQPQPSVVQRETVNPVRGPIFDAEEHSYYGDDEGSGGGAYGFEATENIQDPGEAIMTVYPLTQVRPAIYHDRERRLDNKFEGRQRFVDYPADATAVKDGSPERNVDLLT